MFQTERLSNLLRQLQNGQDLGYFRTLSLILQIVGYFILPVLCIVLLFVTSNQIFNHFIPCILANHMAKRNKKILQSAVDLDAANNMFVENCRQICDRILTIRLILEGIAMLFLVSPFFFAKHDMIMYFAIIAFTSTFSVHIAFPLYCLHSEDHINPVFASFWKYYKRNKL